jgi:hypothetical protein
MEAIMAQLRPSARGLDREMLIYAAGRAAQGSKRPWQMACGVLTVLLCTSLIVRLPQSGPATPGRLVEELPVPVTPVAVPPADHSLAYLELQKTVLKNGLDAMPAHRTVRAPHQKQLDQETLIQDLLSSDEVYSGLL